LEILDFVDMDPKPLLGILKADHTLWPGLRITVDGEDVVREL
jgi:hypothetical protein